MTIVQRVIFACIHNAGRSQMAAAFFNRVADPEKAQAVSAGTQPAARVHPEVIDAMRERGIDLSAAKPQLLTDPMAAQASVLVTMGCGEVCPVVPGLKRLDWTIPDPKDQPAVRVREIRDDLEQRIRALIQAEGWSRSGPAA